MSALFRPQDWPIAVKLLIAFLVVALTPLIVVGILSQRQASNGLLDSARRNLANTSTRTSQVIDDYLKERLTDLQQTATFDSVVRFVDLANSTRTSLGPSNVDQQASYNIMKSKANSLAGAGSYLAVASKSGQVELTSNTDPNQEGQVIPGELRDLAESSYFKEAIAGRTYISNPRLTSYQDRGVQAVFYIASPVRDSRGNPSGVVIQRFSMDAIWQIVNSDFQAVGPGSYAMLIDDTDKLGIRLADSRTADRPDNQTRFLFSVMRTIPSTERGRWVDSGRFPDEFLTRSSLNGENLPGLVDRLNLERFDRTNPFFESQINDNGQDVKAEVSFAPVPAKPGWSYFVVVPATTYAAAANAISTTLLIVLIIAALVVVGFAFLLARILTTPVRQIGRTLGLVGMGDFDARVPVRSRDEMGRLGESLNAMFDNTLTLIQSREEKEVLQDRITILLQEISTVAEGDLTVQAEVTADVTGAIADSFNLMIEELRKIILNIQNATGQASAFFDQMVVNSQQIDKVSDRQAQRVMTVSSSIGDINRSIQQVSEAAALSAQVAQEARQNAHQGGIAVTQTIAGMNRIRGNVQDTAKKIKRLGESSQQISEIVKLIDDIADQTNMLALNAAIQAAMAGEQGKGFSVVSEEVRRLAERSATATREIAALVKSIQDDTAEAVVAMEESTREVVEGSKVADDAGKALASIEAVVDRLATLITNISVVSRQQATSSADIARSMTEISLLTQEASALRRQSAEAVETVARTAEELRVSVSAFKVTGGESGASALPLGIAEDPLMFEPRPVAPVAAVKPNKSENGYDENGSYNAYGNGAPAYYQMASPAPTTGYERPDVYQPPAGDGGSWPSSTPVYVPTAIPNRAPASAGMSNNASANANNFVTTSAEEALDFDLNALLSDDSIFDSIFDETIRPSRHSKNGDDQRKHPQG